MAPTSLNDAAEAPAGFAGAIVRLLDEFEAADLRSAERILEALRRQGQTLSGFPRIRPKDCEAVTLALRKVFVANRSYFIHGDKVVVDRFEAILEAYVETDVRHYPAELLRARILQAEAKLLLNDPQAARNLVGHFADRPYKIEGGIPDIARVMQIDCRARVMQADIDGLSRRAIARAKILSRLSPFRSRRVARDFAEFIGLEAPPAFAAGVFTRLLHDCCRLVLRARRTGGWPWRRLWRILMAFTFLTFASLLLFLLRHVEIRWGSNAPVISGRSRDIVVSRAMGGIGDLLMMTPGLRALGKRYPGRLKLVVDRKFFDIFRNNPHIELIDIDGPPVDVMNCRIWHNLTFCPAGRYESRVRPFVKKGRVELFARSMGVKKGRLDRDGWNIQVELDGDQKDFAQTFLSERRFGRRPIVGVQPYSRDSYKNHPDIGRFIVELSAQYDVVVFHHIADGLPVGPGIATTAGLALGQSIALVARLDAMISVDSAMLHAAAAFDVPVVTMFGPTDGKLFTRHHSFATVLAETGAYPCSPCWRNEDLPCTLTGQFGISPCVGSISFQAVHRALVAALLKRPARANSPVRAFVEATANTGG